MELYPVLICFFLTSLASSDTKLLLQYISKRYGWAFASVGYLLSAKAVVNFILLAVVIPRALRHRRSAEGGAASGDRENMKYAHVCLVVSVIGALAIAGAATVWLLFPALLIYALGSALPVFHSLAPQVHVYISAAGRLARVRDADLLYCHARQDARLAARRAADGYPMVPEHLAGRAALGMPYFVSAACYLAAIAVLSGIRIS